VSYKNKLIIRLQTRRNKKKLELYLDKKHHEVDIYSLSSFLRIRNTTKEGIKTNKEKVYLI